MNSGLRVRVFVLIDALGWNLVQDSGFLAAILPHRQPLRTVLGFSSAAIPTILTGLHPSATGRWNLFYYDPRTSPFRWLRPFCFLPDAVLNHRVTRKILKELGRRMLGLGPLFECCVSVRLLPYFNWVEKRNIYDCGGLETVPGFFDQLAGAGVPHRVYSYHRYTDEQILRQAREDLRAGAAEVYFLYLSEMDHFLHLHRLEEEKVRARIAWYEARVRELYEEVRAGSPDFLFSVFSDHGMAPVRDNCDLVAAVEALGFRMPADYLAVYDSTMARFWFFSERARDTITARLRQTQRGRILAEDELRRLGVFFEDHRFGELVFLLDAGCMMFRSDFSGPRWTPTGMHGYHPDDPDSDAAFLSNRAPARPLRTIADLHAHMTGSTAIGAAANLP